MVELRVDSMSVSASVSGFMEGFGSNFDNALDTSGSCGTFGLA